MVSVSCNSLWRPSLLLGSVFFAVPAFAQIDPSGLPLTDMSKNHPDPAMAQLTSVSQLADVPPTGWAFEALRSLVERYGCIVGYPDRTYRGDRALTRWEFAAGLNACLNSIERSLQAGVSIAQRDLDTLKRLAQEFQAELGALGARVDNLENRAAFLEDHSFSTTTKLLGEAIFVVANAFQGASEGSNTVFQDRVRLRFVSSFTGKDQLNVRLDAGNARRFNLGDGTPEATQSFNLVPSLDNNVNIGWLAYYFPIGERISAYIAAVNGVTYDFIPTLNPYLDSGTGGGKALTVFASANPIYQIGGGAGGGFNYQLSDRWIASLGYLAGDHADPNPGSGLFNGQYAAIAQIAWLDSRSGFGITYVHAYQNRGDLFDIGSSFGIVGTRQANNPFGTPLISDSFGASGFFTITPNLAINGFLGYTNSRNLQGPGNADIWYYSLGFAFPDVGKDGNLGGLVVGVQPYQANNPTDAKDLPIHVEAFYKYQINDNIAITPGLFWLINPGQNSNNTSVIIGTLRTTFTF